MKLIAFIQMYNEVEKGNLVRCLENCRQWADEICIYDDGSTDNSVEIASQYTSHIIRGETNCIIRELYHKQELLDYALTLSPDWIMWIDCDEILDRNATQGGLRNWANYADPDVDAFTFHELNLWRSQTYARTDSLFNNGWFCRLWRVQPEIHLQTKEAVHDRLYPVTIETIAPTPFKVIHYGFWDYNRMLVKIGALGDKEYIQTTAVENWILNETQCDCYRVPDEVFPPENIPPDVWPQPQPLALTELIPSADTEATRPLSMVAGQDSTALWDGRHQEKYHGTYTERLDLIRKALAYRGMGLRMSLFRFDPTGKQIVDIGCGTGRHIVDCIANGAEHVYGLEINQPLINRTWQTFQELHVPPRRYDLLLVPEDVNIPSDTIDIVYCLAVFMHIPLCEVRAYLLWIREILVAGGEAHLQFHQEDGRTLFRSDGHPDHPYTIPDDTVDAMIEEAGLKVTEKQYPRGEELVPVWTFYVCKPKGKP